MKALAAGRFTEALRFSPAVVMGVVASGVWASLGAFRFLRSVPRPSAVESNRRITRAFIVVGVILLGNWIYLFFHLPP